MISKPTTTTYVAYMYAGVMVSEMSAKPVGTRNPHKEAADAVDGAFAFYYYDVVTVLVDVEGELVETRSGHRKLSKTYYIDGEVFTPADVRALGEEYNTLLTNMLANRTDAVRCRTGNFQFFDPTRHELVTT